MATFEIVAHRGAPLGVPENSLPAFEKAITLGADAVELDVRLTKDHIPIVFHYFYLTEATSLDGTIFDYSLTALREADRDQLIPTLEEVLEQIGGRIDMEIEIKGPEPEAPRLIGAVLKNYPDLWNTVEITSYEPQHLLAMQEVIPEIPTDLLFPRPEDWMGPDVVTYLAIQRARLANARAVHLHPKQLRPEVVTEVWQAGIEIHAWDVNDTAALNLTNNLQIPKICTDRLEQALQYRKITQEG